jgi:hypothetical protein
MGVMSCVRKGRELCEMLKMGMELIFSLSEVTSRIGMEETIGLVARCNRMS